MDSTGAGTASGVKVCLNPLGFELSVEDSAASGPPRPEGLIVDVPSTTGARFGTMERCREV